MILVAASEAARLVQMHDEYTGSSLFNTVTGGFAGYTRGLRLVLVISLLLVCSRVAVRVVRLLPPDHPVRVFTEGTTRTYVGALRR